MTTYSSLNNVLLKSRENYGFDFQHSTLCFLGCFSPTCKMYQKFPDQGYGRQEIVNLDKCHPSQVYSKKRS